MSFASLCVFSFFNFFICPLVNILVITSVSMYGEVTSRNHQAYSQGHLVHNNTVTSILLNLSVPCLVPFKVSLQRTAKKFLHFEHPTAKKFLCSYRATAKKFLRFPGLKLKQPAISLRTQKEVLARALFLGCTVYLFSMNVVNNKSLATLTSKTSSDSAKFCYVVAALLAIGY